MTEICFTAKATARLAGLALALALGAAPAAAQVPAAVADQARLQQGRALAATCAQCHGSDGRALPGTGLAVLAGLPRDYLAAQMKAFREGQRPATVMHQIVKGYSAEQVELMATWFAAQTGARP